MRRPRSVEKSNVHFWACSVASQLENKTRNYNSDIDVSAHVGFPAKVAGTSPEGHEEACARNDHMSGRPYLGDGVLNQVSVA